MGWYSTLVLPRLIDAACGLRMIGEQRERIVPRARGRVLEIGAGSGRNLALYRPDRVDLVWAVDPSLELYRMAARRAAAAPFPVRFFVRPADEPGLALTDGAVDTVVVTYALCTIDEPVLALEEARRVLAPGGRLLFAEHGRSPDPDVRRWQERVTPAWQRVAGGCRLDRDPLAILHAAGFRVEELETGTIGGWKLAEWHYLGVAVAAEGGSDDSAPPAGASSGG